MKKIMFSDAFCLTLAVLNGSKTMIRQLLKIPKTCNGKEVYSFNVLTNNAGTQCVDLVDENGDVLGIWKPHYEVGEVVAIAQPYKDIYPNADFEMVGDGFMTESAGWTNKMFVKASLMKRHIRFTDIKVERLQDISDEDVLREGVWQMGELFYVNKAVGEAPEVAFPTAREAFWYLIDKISSNGTWESNPFIAAYSFELID
ncbi:hypothetical protein [Prevotella pallens]|uniref:hypothetical protein n=1 Tax=Prevotella pallens TaxID=60133 RepID=UPI001CABE39E|nr:hypothetical protein [Prevotella pallens]MBF1517829.1 hypothetical protein [Prevotella pallens]